MDVKNSLCGDYIRQADPELLKRVILCIIQRKNDQASSIVEEVFVTCTAYDLETELSNLFANNDASIFANKSSDEIISNVLDCLLYTSDAADE